MSEKKDQIKSEKTKEVVKKVVKKTTKKTTTKSKPIEKKEVKKKKKKITEKDFPDLLQPLILGPKIGDITDEIDIMIRFSNDTLSTYPNSYIAFVKEGKPVEEYDSYQYISAKGKKTVLKVKTPSVCGTYRIYYFPFEPPFEKYQFTAKSNKILIGPQVDMKGTLKMKTKKILLKWKQTYGKNIENGWIGVFKAEDPSLDNYTDWVQVANGTGQEELLIPYTPGKYELRFIVAGGVIAKGANIEINGKDTIKVEPDDEDSITVYPNIVSVDPYWSYSWVGLYHKGETDMTNYVQYKYLSYRTKPVDFEDIPEGDYEVKLFLTREYVPCCSVEVNLDDLNNSEFQKIIKAEKKRNKIQKIASKNQLKKKDSKQVVKSDDKKKSDDSSTEKKSQEKLELKK